MYVYGTSQSNQSQVTRLTIPHTMTGAQLKRRLLNNRTNTNYVLLYNNHRVDGEASLSQQVPDFASVVLCALGKGGGGKENGDNVSGMI